MMRRKQHWSAFTLCPSVSTIIVVLLIYIVLIDRPQHCQSQQERLHGISQHLSARCVFKPWNCTGSLAKFHVQAWKSLGMAWNIQEKFLVRLGGCQNQHTLLADKFPQFQIEIATKVQMQFQFSWISDERIDRGMELQWIAFCLLIFSTSCQQSVLKALKKASGERMTYDD